MSFVRLTCPNNPEHKTFETVAHVMELWSVDEHGEWAETLTCLAVTVKPDFDGNQVTCHHCGADAKVEYE